jgi:hypothetical protein
MSNRISVEVGGDQGICADFEEKEITEVMVQKEQRADCRGS